MNKKKVGIKPFFGFIDKKIITPITKFFVWCLEKMKFSNKFFEKFLSKKSSMIIISLLLSVGIFYYVDTKSTILSENSAEVLYEQKINAIYNEESYVIEGIPSSVDVTLIGRKSDLYLAKQIPIDSIFVNLEKLKPGTHEVSLSYKGAVDTVDYKIDPSTITVVIYSKMSEARTLSVDLINKDKLNSKLSIEKVELDRQEVIIKGAQYKIDKVASVKALVDINNLPKQEVGSMVLNDVQLIAYDESGNIVDVEIVPTTVTATITITSPSKVVPIKIVPDGTLGFGKSISTISSSVDSVTIYGDEESLNNIKNIEVTIDVKGLTTNKKFNATIKKPSGIREISDTTTIVNVTLDEEISKEFENIQLEYENLSDDYTLNAATDSDKYATVVVKGVSSVIESLTEDDIKVYVDLEGYEPGTYDVDVLVKGNDVRVSYEVKVSKVKLIISKKR